MIGLAFYSSTQTTLDLNGPFLRFTSEPDSETVNDGGSVTLTGVATAEFKHNPTTIPGERVTNTGAIAYQWYIGGVAAEDVSGKISGSQTNELTLSNLVSPTDNGKTAFLRATYTGSAYQSEEGAVTAGIAASTGNGVNQPVDTSQVTVVINPTITIDTQPQDATAAQGIDATFTVSASTSDDTDVTYQWNQDGNPLSDSSTVSGANTPTLTISSTTVGDSDITVTVSHPTAGNSPVTSDTATFTVVSARTIIDYYQHADTGAFYGSGSQNLFDGPLTITADPNNAVRTTSFHSPEKDIKVKITLQGGAGASRNGHRGGQGGKSVFELTLEQNQEYILKLGAQVQPTGGTNGGGGAAYLYKKARLIIAIGGGGGAGTNGRGGDGGGTGIAGETPPGSNGTGGPTFDTGALPTTGIFPGGAVTGGVNWTSKTAGRVSGCPMGFGYFTSRFSACDDMGQQQFRNSSGNIISQTPTIERGYKPGIGHRNNGGNGSGNEGGGASGAHGGNAATSNGRGGGGASGYTSGDATILETQLGGNSSTNATVTFEYVPQ